MGMDVNSLEAELWSKNMQLMSENDRLRGSLVAAGINLTTASIVIEKLGHPAEAEPFKRAADQVLDALKTADPRPAQEASHG